MKSNPEDKLKTLGIPGPSAALREKVLETARQQWSVAAQDGDVFWVFPVLRLAASIAIVFTALTLTGRSDRRVREYGQFFARPHGIRPETVLALEYPTARMIRVLGVRRPGTEAKAIISRRTDLRELLDEPDRGERDPNGASVRQIRDAALS